MGSALAEQKPKISIGEALELVKKTVSARYDDDRASHNRAFSEIEKQVGGQTERLDRQVIDQGRAWATRLAVIARRTSGGKNGYDRYQTSKTGAALEGAVKKIYGVLGELEAMVAVDIEVSLFDKVDKSEYFGGDYDGIKKLTAKRLLEVAEDMGEHFDQDALVESILESCGEKVDDDVKALLDQYEIELPEPKPEGDEPASGKGGGRRRKRS
jgi:hypothetical protein